MKFQDSALWLSTLAARQGDGFSEPRQKLSSAFLQFREHVLPVAEEVAQSVPGYTNHGISHCDGLWDTASKLQGTHVTLNPAEAFVLGGAFLVHDLGMGLSAYSGGLLGIFRSTEWLDVLASYFPTNYKSLQEIALADVAKDATWNGLSNVDVKTALTTYLRMHHASQAEKIMGQTWELTNGEPDFLLPDAQMRNWYGQAIGRIAKSHWQDVSALPEIFSGIPLGAPGDFPSDWTVDELKLACLLRLADAAQIDDRRANLLLTPHRQPQGDSLAHWQFQERLMAVQVVDRRLVFNSANPFPVTLSAAWWNAFDAITMIDDELRKVDNLCADLNRPRYSANAVAGADSSTRFATFVKTDGWRPVDARPYIGDPNSVISQLGGRALYGQHAAGVVPFRELIANALDATRAFRLAFEDADVKPIVIQFAEDDGQDIFSIQDFGVGMTESDVLERLCNFGVSGWKGGAAQAAFPGLLSEGYSPTGQFGIGFFAVFMAADYVKVTTRHVDSSKADTLVLEFSQGLLSRPLLRNASRDEQLLIQGTKIELHLKKRLTDDYQFFAKTPRSRLQEADYVAECIRHLAFTADESIDVKPMGSKAAHRAVSRNQWLTSTNEEIFDALNPGRDLSAPGYDLVRKRFASMLSPIHDSNGKEIGRIGVDALTANGDGSEYVNFRDSAAYSGGLYSTGVPDVVGILSGTPMGAARNELGFDISLPQMQEWYRSQVVKLTAENPDPAQRLRVQRYGISIGVLSDDLPFALSSVGYIDPVETKKLLQGKVEFVLIENYGEPLTISTAGDKINGFFGGNDFVIVESEQLVVPYGPFEYEEKDLPIRSNEFVEDFTEHVRTHQNFDPIFWWNENYASPGAELLRLASEVWCVNLIDIVLSLEGLYLSDETDNRLRMSTLSGKDHRATALRVKKP